jgi:hypothetical protein
MTRTCRLHGVAQLAAPEVRHLGVAAQVEIESKSLKRSIILKSQVRISRRFYRVFDGVNLQRPTWAL